jgi:DivIVA domain-containing protein
VLPARRFARRDTIGPVLTILGYTFVLILVGGVLFLLVSFVFGRGEELAPVPPDSVPVELPEQRPATSADIERLRLPVVLRGYRMHEVDWVLERLAGELDKRDAEIARLQQELARVAPPEATAAAEHEATPVDATPAPADPADEPDAPDEEDVVAADAVDKEGARE